MLHRLPDVQPIDVGLVDAGADPHRRRVDDIEDRQSGSHFLALLHFAHRSVLPGGLQHDNAVDRRLDAHPAGIALGVAPRVLRAIALNLEGPQVGGISAALDVEGPPQLLEFRPRLVERQPVLFGGDRRRHLVLEHLEIRALDGVLRRLHLGLVVRPRSQLLAPFLVDLLDEIEVLGLAVVGRLHLRLAIELDQEVAAFHRRARLDQADDHERASGRTGQPRDHNWMAAHRLDRAVETKGRSGVRLVGHGDRRTANVERHRSRDAHEENDDEGTHRQHGSIA